MNQSPEVLEKWRLEFEALCYATDISIERTRLDGEYDLVNTESRWRGFMSGRGTVCISLPQEDEYCDSLLNLSKTDVVEAIEAQGYSVK